MNAWITDADAIQINTLDWKELIVKNEEIHDFLTIGDRDQKFFIVAPKGSGKTLLLKAKSKGYRDSSMGSGYTFIPQRQLCEKMTKATANFSTHELNQYRNLDVWEEIWKLSLHILIIRNVKDLTLPDTLSQLVGQANTLSNILEIILQNRSHLYEYLKLVSSQLRPQIQQLQRQVAVFVDNVDEAFDAHVGDSYREHRVNFSDRETLSPHVWVNAQLGLIQAVKDICLPNKHIKIFIALRSEAYDQDQKATGYQNRTYTTQLDYSREMLEEIFKTNILQTASPRLSYPESDNLFQKFLGIQYLPHISVKYSSGEAVQEHLFNYIYRHTFGRPREIVGMGEGLSKLSMKRRDLPNIRECVNEESYRLLNQYKREQIPYFRAEVYQAFCKLVSSNVFDQREAQRIDRQIKMEFGHDNTVEQLYKMGLVGFVEQGGYKGGYQQRFLKVANYSSDSVMPKNSEYYLIHPALARDLGRARGGRLYNPYTIIGYDLPFYGDQDKKKNLHVHFGLSRLSRSMLLPILHANTHLVVIQSPDQETWGEITLHRKIEFVINQTESVELSLIHDGMGRNEVGNLIGDWKNGKISLLVYTENVRIIRQVLAHVQSLSTSKANGGISNFIDLMDDIPFDRKILLFPFEYTDQETQELEKEFAQRDINWTIVPFIADLFYYQKKIEEEQGIIHIQCETKGDFFIQDIGGEVREIFPSHEVTRYIRDSKVLNFYKDRHRFLSDATFRLCKIYYNYPDLGVSRETFEQLIEVFCQMQAERLVAITPTKVIEQAYAHATTTERVHILTRYGLKMLERFDALPDAYKKIIRLQTYQRKTQKKKTIPTVGEFDNYFRKSRVDYRDIRYLRQLLGFPPNKNVRSVFLCVSHHDEAFAQQVHHALSAYGAEALLFNFEHSEKDLITTLKESNLRSKDRIIFISSEPFIKSQICQAVLTKFRKNLEELWDHMLITIRVDPYLTELDEQQFPAPENTDLLANIRMLKSHYLKDWSMYVNGNNPPGFQEAAKDLISQYLRR